MAAAIDPGVLKTVNAYLQVLRAHMCDFEAVWLFGSFAEDRAAEDSDIDIAVVMPEVKSKFFQELELTRFRRNIDTRIEPHVINAEDLDSPFFEAVMRKGIRIA
jgi:uncharacterized protein